MKTKHKANKQTNRQKKLVFVTIDRFGVKEINQNTFFENHFIISIRVFSICSSLQMNAESSQ